jgi:hypothetical protein
VKSRLKNSVSLDSLSPYWLRRAATEFESGSQYDNDFALEPIEERLGDFDNRTKRNFEAPRRRPSKLARSHAVSKGQAGLRRSDSLSSLSPRRATKPFFPRKVRNSVIKSTGADSDSPWRENGTPVNGQHADSIQLMPSHANMLSLNGDTDDALLEPPDLGTVVRSKPRGHFPSPLEPDIFGTEGIVASPKRVRAARKPISNLLLRPGDFSECEAQQDTQTSHRDTSSHHLVAIGVATAVTSTSSLQEASDNLDSSKSVETMGSHTGHSSVPHKGLRTRLSRWFKSAKHVIKNTCNRRRSSSNSS